LPLNPISYFFDLYPFRKLNKLYSCLYHHYDLLNSSISDEITSHSHSGAYPDIHLSQKDLKISIY